MFGVGEALWKIRSARSVSRPTLVAQQWPPEGFDRVVVAGSGVSRMIDGVIWVGIRVANCIVGTGFHGVCTHATTRPEVGGECGRYDHGAMACRGESIRMKISRR
jgi:hypothetical protein